MKKQQTLLTPENLCTKRSDIDMEARRKLNNQKNKVLWFTIIMCTKITLEVRALDRNASETIKMKRRLVADLT